LLGAGFLALSLNPLVSMAMLTFDGSICTVNPCGPGSTISQSYGDVPGQIDVIYDGDISAPSLQGLQFWGGPSGMTNVATGVGNPATAEIFLQPVAGFQVMLLGFDLGVWGSSQLASYTLLTGSGDELDSWAGTLSAGTPMHFDGLWTSADGIRIQFGPDWNVAIDNIDFSVSADVGVAPVPLPAAIWMLGGALAGLYGLRRKRISATPMSQ